MTRKQIKKIAKEIVELEIIHNDPNCSKDEKNRAENQMMAITNKIMELPNGIDILSEIDEIASEMLKEKC